MLYATWRYKDGVIRTRCRPPHTPRRFTINMWARKCLKEDTEIDGEVVPKGTVIKDKNTVSSNGRIMLPELIPMLEQAISELIDNCDDCGFEVHMR